MANKSFLVAIFLTATSLLTIFTAGTQPSFTPSSTSIATSTSSVAPLTASQSLTYNYWSDPIALSALVCVIVIVVVASILAIYFKNKKPV